MGSSPKPQAPIIPARKPDRTSGVSPEDVVLGGQDNVDDATTVLGKRALIRPSVFSSLNLGG